MPERWASIRNELRYCKWLVALLVFTSCTSQQVEKLPVLEYKQADTVGGNVGIRPYRKGGIRLESERLGSKTIYHNYGHGGAGISLAPGSVMKSISQFEDGRHKEQPLAVLGAGYMGLLTADILSDKGYKVTIYADQFPERGFVFKGKPCITSLVGGGYWMPFGLDTNGHVAFQHELQKLSWQYYKECIQRGDAGIRFRDAYGFGEYTPFDEPLEESVMQDMKPHDTYVSFGQSEKIVKAVKFKTISIASDIFLNDLYDKLKSKKNVVFKQKKLCTSKDIEHLPQKIIFNCTGNGAKQLFSDNHMKAIRGQIMYLKEQPQHDNVFIFGRGDYGRFSIYPLIKRMGVGLTYEEGVDECEILPDTFDKFRKMLDGFYTEVM